MSLEQLGAQANAHYKAGERANQKAGEHATSAGMYLAEAKRRIEETTPYGQRERVFGAFLQDRCPDIKAGIRRANQLIAHATGKKPIEEVNARAATSMRKTRERRNAISSEQRCSEVHQPLRFQPPPEPDERDAILTRIMAKLTKLSIDQLHAAERLIPDVQD
jgi:hypothetical protein